MRSICYTPIFCMVSHYENLQNQIRASYGRGGYKVIRERYAPTYVCFIAFGVPVINFTDIHLVASEK